MTTLEDVRYSAETADGHAEDASEWRRYRDNDLRACYRAGNGTLQQLANATGLSKARVAQIVNDGEGDR